MPISRAVFGPLHVRYYTQRASAGLIVTEATNVSRDAIGSPLTPGLFDEDQVATWRSVTDAVHATRVAESLHSCGTPVASDTLWCVGGVLPVAPSAVRIEGQLRFTASGMKEYERRERSPPRKSGPRSKTFAVLRVMPNGPASTA